MLVYPGVSERQRNSKDYGEAGELGNAFLKSGEAVLIPALTLPRLPLPLLQVKLSGSHLTPVCYSFISYVQVSGSEVVPQ